MSDLNAKMHQKFNFDWGSALDFAGSLQRSPHFLAVFKGATFNGWEGKGKLWEGERESREKWEIRRAGRGGDL